MFIDLSEVTQRLRRMSSEELDVSGSYQNFLQDLINEGKKTLAVEHVSVWLFDDITAPKKLINVASTQWQNDLSADEYPQLLCEEFPNYFKAIASGISIDAHNAASDPRTSEFKDGYLDVHNITTMLDTVIFKNGIPHGVVCFEGTGEQRSWQSAEIAYAEMMADCCSRRLLVNDLWSLQKQLTKMAFQDALTGLKNRRYLMDYAHREISRHIRLGQQLSVVMLDIDHFKQINDSYGHEIGDIVLKAFSQQCVQALRTEDCLCRLGGEEFIVLLPNTSVEGAVEVAERLRKNVEKNIIESGTHHIQVTVSCGVGEVNLAKPFSQSLKEADHAVYDAKAKGRNCVVVY
ncbi:sensor domain-containing diguanylate cyclase [Pseudoalteromonas sp. S16_S37]|uniref:sensor domain-containing diguanylate cyclase n=1 Tax=Pseudoalteromonas sp. S16_S37 TaxID=2720228 RepID=UPI001680AAD5|nr:sensor domain-containing diguanylate cyclase [Pseudoalteromonas sp. S16_S37]MBD1583412.1 sensor domain-containing diguanylate cyclase [Pseudoalteromonas sp. S16_S37]